MYWFFRFLCNATASLATSFPGSLFSASFVVEEREVAARLGSQNKETAAMLVSRPNLPGIIMQTFSFVFVVNHGC